MISDQLPAEPRAGGRQDGRAGEDEAVAADEGDPAVRGVQQGPGRLGHQAEQGRHLGTQHENHIYKIPGEANNVVSKGTVVV